MQPELLNKSEAVIVTWESWEQPELAMSFPAEAPGWASRKPLSLSPRVYKVGAVGLASVEEALVGALRAGEYAAYWMSRRRSEGKDGYLASPNRKIVIGVLFLIGGLRRISTIMNAVSHNDCETLCHHQRQDWMHACDSGSRLGFASTNTWTCLSSISCD